MRRLVEVHYYIKDGQRETFYNEIINRGIAEAARAEEGNEKYEYYFSPENENELLLLEIWSSAEAVKLHMETQHYKELSELKKVFVTETVFRRFEINEI